eukprot:GFUD01034041.1.p1 GENE.GFUD01034041.1~~GFUD01034041.1.p1  ORF type:complete len:198 (+),score=29.67 GFUD01034041.1:42-635(+)
MESSAEMYELTAQKICQLDPFRDDPIKPDYLVTDTEEGNNSDTVHPEGDKSGSPEMLAGDFCKCTKCTVMPTREENVCCKNKRFSVSMPDSSCVTEHEDFDKIVNKTVLTINLKTVWNTGLVDTNDTDISNRNLRYSAYRSLCIWLRNGKRKKSYRSSLPSCVVTSVRQLYPDATYTGYRLRSPVLQKKMNPKKTRN